MKCPPKGAKRNNYHNDYEAINEDNQISSFVSSDLEDFYGGAQLVKDQPNALTSPMNSSAIQTLSTVSTTNSAQSTQMVTTAMTNKAAAEAGTTTKSLKPLAYVGGGILALIFFNNN